MPTESYEELRRRSLATFFYYYAKGLFFLIALIAMCELISFWFYIVAAPLIGLLFFRLALLGHEGTHGLICRNRKLNTFIGRYLCHFPAFTSHSKYTTTHLMHHRFLGTLADVDRPLYLGFPQSKARFLLRQVWEVITLQTNLRFIQQVTELPRLIPGHRPRIHVKDSDLRSFCLFWGFVLLFFLLMGWMDRLFLYWVIPHVLTISYVEFVNALQHAPVQESDPTFSRNIFGEWYVPLLLPVNINYHSSHHKDVTIPFYNLPKFQKISPCQSQPLRAALREILR